MTRTISGALCLCIMAASFSGCATNEKGNVGEGSVSSVNSASSVSTDISDNSETSDSEISNSESDSSETSDGAADGANTETGNRMTSKTLPLYVVTQAQKFDQAIYYADGQMDIPYISINDVVDFLKIIYAGKGDTGYTLTLSDNNGVIDLEREIDGGAIIDFNNKTLLYDYEDFFRESYSSTPADTLSKQYVNENGEPIYFERTNDSFVREGKAI